jgi:hypothetical protein
MKNILLSFGYGAGLVLPLQLSRAGCGPIVRYGSAQIGLSFP